MSTTAENIQRQISENPILIYMKGTPQLPQCGFSAQTVQALMSCGERFAFVNVLDNPDIRSELPKIANWPTFPQLWVEGELVGGLRYRGRNASKRRAGKTRQRSRPARCSRRRW